jgi:hypothetical protein
VRKASGSKDKDETMVLYVGVGVALGLSVGTGLGAAFGNWRGHWYGSGAGIRSCFGTGGVELPIRK